MWCPVANHIQPPLFLSPDNIMPDRRLGLSEIPRGCVIWEKGLGIPGLRLMVIQEVPGLQKHTRTIVWWLLRFSWPVYKFLAIWESPSTVDRLIVFELLVLSFLGSSELGHIHFVDCFGCIGPNGATQLGLEKFIGRWEVQKKVRELRIADEWDGRKTRQRWTGWEDRVLPKGRRTREEELSWKRSCEHVGKVQEIGGNDKKKERSEKNMKESRRYVGKWRRKLKTQM